MSWRKTLILGLIFAVLVLAYFLVMPRKGVKAEQRLLAGIDKITKFTLKTRSGTSTVGIDSATGKWYLLEPVRYPADTVAVREVVDKALEAAYTVVVADSGNPEEYGLAPVPWVDFSVNGVGFKLGDESPTRNGVYAQIYNDKRILLVPREIRTTLLRVPTDFRDKSIMPKLDIAAVKKVIVKRPAGELVFAKKDSKWWITQPIESEAEQNYVHDLISSTINARAADFAAEDHSDSVIAARNLRQAGTITLIDTTGKEYVLNVLGEYSKEDSSLLGCYGWTPSKKPLFEIASYLITLVSRPAQYYRSRQICKATSADHIEIIAPESTVLIAGIKAGGWFIFGKDTMLANSKTIEKFLRDIEYAYIDSFLKDKRFRDSGWRFVLSIEGKPCTLFVGDTAWGYRIQVRKGSGPEYLYVAKSRILPWKSYNTERFVQKRMIDIPISDINEIEVRLGGKTYKFIRRSKEDWRVKTPSGARDMKIKQIRPTIEAVVHMAYKKVSLDTAFSLDASHSDMIASITDKNGAKHRLYLGKPEGEFRPAYVEGEKIKFLVPAPAYDDVKRRLENVLKLK